MKTTTPLLETTLVLSTAHLRPRFAEPFEDDVGDLIDVCGPGVLLHVSEDAECRRDVWETRSRSLQLPMELAASLGDCWIRFDPDGPVLEGLPIYDWE